LIVRHRYARHGAYALTFVLANANKRAGTIIQRHPSARPLTSLQPRRPHFLLLPMAAVLLPLMMMGIGGWISWRSTWADAAAQLERKASAGAEYASRVLAGYVVALGRINDSVRGLSDAEIRARERELHSTLLRLVGELPQASASYVFDRQGHALVGATAFPVPRDLSVADRDFFLALSAGTPPALHVSQVYEGRLDHNLYFAISGRRLGGTNGLPDGEFDGVVNITVSPALVAAGMKRFLDDDSDMLALIRPDGQVLVRSSGPAGKLPPVSAGSPFFRIAASPGGIGTYRVVSTVDNVSRLVAMQPVEGFPMFVVAARSRGAIIAEWRDRMAAHLVFGIPATLALLALSLRVRRSQLQLFAENAGLERALGESDARLHRVQSAGGVLSFEVVSDGSVICDDQFRALWGVSPNTPMSFETMTERIHPDDRADFVTAFSRLGQDGGSFNIELRVVLADSERWVLTLGEAAAGRNDIPSRIVGVAMDISERKRMEAAMHDREVRLRDLVATLDLATVMVRDFNGTILFWSEGCVRLFGWTAAEAIGRTTHDLLHTVSPEPGKEIEAKLMADGQWNGDLLQTRRDGTQVTIATRKVVRRDAAGNPVAIMATLSDVTALRRAQVELQQLNRRLESLVRDEVAKRESAQQRAAHAERIQALGQLAGGIAHDLNNVLQAITSGSSLATRDAENPERVRRLARLMTEAAQRGAAVTRRLLSFSRRADLRAEPIEPKALLTDIAEVLAHTLGGHVSCEVSAPDNLPRLLADRGQLETALVNLATNARDAMPDGGTIVLSAAQETILDSITHPAMVPAGRFVRLTVRDFGTGMDAATLARVPEPFFTTKRDGNGTGLGLAMVSGFAQQSQGAMHIDSELGQGTSVSLWLPEAPAKAPRPARTEPSQDWDPTVPGRLLLVDDDQMVRDAVAQQLEQAGYSVTVAQDGPQALAMLDEGLAVDVLVCDLSMPGMGGVAVIREAQIRRPGLPAVMLTGYVGDATALPAEGATFALLRKPAPIAELTDVIAILLSQQGGRQQAVPIIA
jgi:PAS domain S-box-containing protein